MLCTSLGSMGFPGLQSLASSGLASHPRLALQGEHTLLRKARPGPGFFFPGVS